MAHFDVPVSDFMSKPLMSVEPSTELPMVQHKLVELGLSSLAVVDGDKLVGVVSRTDLLRVGQKQTGQRGRSSLLVLPGKSVSEVMSSEPLSVGPEDSVADAASLMRKNRVHRVFVVRGGSPVGVLSTRDLMTIVRDKQAGTLIRDIMSSPVFTIRGEEPISLATERLEKARVSGLVVVDDDWPVGVFTQTEALECRDLPRHTQVDEVMNPGMVCMPVTTKIWRAAQQAIAMRVRRIIAVDKREMVGIIGGLDFAGFAAQ